MQSEKGYRSGNSVWQWSMILRIMLVLVFSAGVFYCAAPAVGADESLQWWQRGQNRWYYKDDWSAKFLQGRDSFKTTVEVPGAIDQAFVYVWGSGQYTLMVNGRKIGTDMDNGTIEDYDLTGVLRQGRNDIEVRGGSEIAVEGAVVLENGLEIKILSDDSWGGKASDTRRQRRAGYAGDTHMARILAVTTEQQAKVMVNNVHSTANRIADMETYNFWKNRDPREVLEMGEPTVERQAWSKMQQLLDEAEEATAEPTRLIKAGRYAEAIKAAKPAVKLAQEAEGILRFVMDKLDARNAERAAALGKSEAKGHVKFNASDLNRLGWVASAEPLDNDPVFWEFDVSPDETGTIGLAGYWRFKLDPEDQGEQKGYAKSDCDHSEWDWLYAPTKWGWERQGYTGDNAPGFGSQTKPYNGVAWYRKKVFIPKSWSGNDLVLNIGNHRDWYDRYHGSEDHIAFNGKFMPMPEPKSSGAGIIHIPAEMVKFGGYNTIVNKAVNHSNMGGIMNWGLRISVAGRVPQNRRSICGPASVRQEIFETSENGQVQQITYSSALSPAVVVAVSGNDLQLCGWKARGFNNPNRVTFVKNGVVVNAMLRAGTQLDPKQMSENWLLVYSDEPGDNVGRPTLIVLEQRPEEIEFEPDGFGGSSVEMEYEKDGPRVVLVRPFDEPLDRRPNDEQVELCRLWSRAALSYPVGYLEQLKFDGEICKVRMDYEYLELEDEWDTEPLKLAPLPMLFSYAMEHNWPKAEYAGKAIDLGNRSQGGWYPQSDTGTYKALEGTSKLSYSFNRSEPKTFYKGIGIWGEWTLGNELFGNVAKWGFNSTRPQMPIPKLEDYGNKEKMRRIDTMINGSRKYNLPCFINWFTGQSIPMSGRKNFIDRWIALTKYCKDLPEDLFIYDIINEPAGFRWDDYNEFMKQTTEAIRKIDKTHWISVEAGGGWAQPEDFDMTEPTGDEKTIYQHHFYGPHTGDCHRRDLWWPRYQLREDRFRSYEAVEEQLLSAVRFSIRNNQCMLFHGEFGTSFLGPDKAPEQWLIDVLDLNRKYRIGWNWWTYQGDSINRTGLLAGERENPLLSILREYAAKEQPK